MNQLFERGDGERAGEEGALSPVTPLALGVCARGLPAAALRGNACLVQESGRALVYRIAVDPGYPVAVGNLGPA